VIFVVDDDASVRASLTRLMRSMGFDSMSFASAEDFLQGAPTEPGGCVILDVYMPGMGGLVLQEHLSRERPGLAVVVMTAHEDQAVREAALKAGAVAFLKKPFEESALLAAIQRSLGDVC
jgi:FixJ family two-component response regulator